MGVLDDYLLGRGQERFAVAQARFEAMRDSKIVALSDKGALINTLDRRVSTNAAAVAMQRTTGSVPENMFKTLSRESLVPFGEGGAERFKKLQDRGVGVGSSAYELEGVNYQGGKAPQRPQRFGEVLRDFFRGNGARGNEKKRGGFNGANGGGRFGGAANPEGGKISQPTEALRRGYGTQGTLSGNGLNLNPFLNRRRLLHEQGLD